jgi:hypothetical protein
VCSLRGTDYVLVKQQARSVFEGLNVSPKRYASWNILVRRRTSAKLVRICKVSALLENLRHSGLYNRDLSVTQCTADIATITATLYCPLQGEPPCWQLASVGIKAASFCCRHQSIIGVVMCASEGSSTPTVCSAIQLFNPIYSPRPSTRSWEIPSAVPPA